MNRASLKTGTALAATLALTACGGGGGGVASTPTPTVVVTPTPTPAPTPTPTPTSNFNTAEYQRSNAAVQANAITAYDNGATGAGIIVGIVDSGINPALAEFSGKIHAASADVAGNRPLADEGGHGTSIADVLAGAKNDSGIHGVAFGATILVARSDTPGSCAAVDGCDHNDNDIARGVNLAVANGAKVINLSLGGSPANNTLRAAIDRATAAGVILVISAGNEGVTNPTVAANADPFALVANESLARGLVIIAGSVETGNTTLSDFSNRAGTGAPHYIAALGRRVRSIDQTGATFLFSGTSYSAPVVAGAVALLEQAFPNLTPAQVVDLLFRTAVDMGDAGNDPINGFGALDIARAFQAQGKTALVDSKIPVDGMLTSVLSGPMGDASPSKSGLSAVVLDEYARAFHVSLDGSLTHAAPLGRLAPALGIGPDARGTRFGTGAVSLTVRQTGASSFVERSLLATTDQNHARALAGAFVSRLGPKTSLALGISQSGLALVEDLERSPAPLLVSRHALRDWGFESDTGQSFALARRMGSWTLTANAETGDARVWQGFREPRAGYRDHPLSSFGLGLGRQLGPVSLTGRMTRLTERDTVLGAAFTGFLGSAGAQSWFADGQALLDAGHDWSLAGAMRYGWTQIAAGGTRPGADHLRTMAWSLDLAKVGLLQRGDRFGLRLSQPLRVTSGGLNLWLPVSYDYATMSAGYASQRLNLAPSGRETSLEAAYGFAIPGGQISANAFWRDQPGNIAAAPSDAGLAIRLAVRR